jgi:hypothetical protein
LPEDTHVLVEGLIPTKTTEPDTVEVPARAAVRTNPIVDPAFASLKLLAPESYPVVSTDPEPICSKQLLDPFVLTPLNITVILFAQLGIPVKSIAVPLVEAVAVPDVIVPPLTVELVIVAPVIAPLAFTVSTSAVVAPLLPLASLIVPSGEDGTERVKFWVAVADWPI